MFDKGEYVVCGNTGICVVEDIRTIDISGAQKEKLYYILKPLFQASGTLYIPVEGVVSHTRRVLTKQEVNELLAAIPEIQMLGITNEKMREAAYKECIRQCDRREWIRMLKTLHHRKQERNEQGKKVTAVDERYLKLAKEGLCQEISFVLGMTKEETERLLEEKIVAVAP